MISVTAFLYLGGEQTSGGEKKFLAIEQNTLALDPCEVEAHDHQITLLSQIDGPVFNCN